MDAFTEYLCQQLDEMLKRRSVVVFYDPRREFELLFDRELEEVGTGYDGLLRVFVKDRLTFIARYQGSHFGLRHSVEPIAELDKPDPLIVYLPGIERDRSTSVLMELEKGGTTYEPQLRKLARLVLRKRFTDGQIDEMLKPGTRYDDVVSFVSQGEQGQAASILHTVFNGAPSEAILTQWIAEPDQDDVLEHKDATGELFQLIEARLGLSVPSEESLADARERVLRFVLVNEFRCDLDCDAPASVAMVPDPPTKEHSEHLRVVARSLRQGHADAYVELATRVEQQLGLDRAGLSGADLGQIDTFPFEERALLAVAGAKIEARDYDGALGIAAGRRRSFWVDRDVARRSQWEACRLVAELGREIEKVQNAVNGCSSDPARWVEAYAAEDGWHRVDALQRRLESWVATMDEDPEVEKGLAVTRREHEELLKGMADGFSKAFIGASWAVPGALQQTQVYPEVVQKMGGPVAYFFVDAMRFEMGVELARQLDGAQDLVIRPAIAALPTITPVGMAALLPGASASFSVVEHKGGLASRIEGTTMSSRGERMKFLKTKVPGAVDMLLGSLLTDSSKKVSKAVDGKPLVVVLSQEIDALGENVDELTARSAMEGVIGNVARAIRKLAAAGVEHFVITADHGHQFSLRKEDDMKTESPGGTQVDLHRRCWIGHGGANPPGTARVNGAELGYDTNLDFVFPTGLGVFKSGGGLTFHHGSVSLQELLVPVVSLRIPSKKSRPAGEETIQLLGLPNAVTNRTLSVQVAVGSSLFGEESIALRVILLSGGEQVGQAGMAVGADLDRSSGVIQAKPGSKADIVLILTRDDCSTVRVVALNPTTDAVLAQTDDLPVKLGI